MLLLSRTILWSYLNFLLIVATQPPQIIILSPAKEERLVADLDSGVGEASLALSFLHLPLKGTPEHDALNCCIQLKNGASDCSPVENVISVHELNLYRLIPGVTHIVEVSLFSGQVTPENLVAYEQRSFFVAHHPNTYAEGGVEMSIFGTMTNGGRQQDNASSVQNSVWQDAASNTVAASNTAASDTAAAPTKAAMNDSTLRSLYFDSVYKSRVWSAGGMRSGSDSGPGSSLENTIEIRRALLQVVRDRDVKSILDIPCGDLHWMQHVMFPDYVQYAGADVSSSLIAKNQAAFPDRSFFVADLVEDDHDFKMNGKIPDLIFVRHLFWHLPMEDNMLLLKRLATLGAKYVMLSTRLRADRNNATFVPAMGHPTNLFRAPYCLSDPLVLIKDGEIDTYMGLWKIGTNEPSLMSASDSCMGAEYNHQYYGNLQ